MYRKYRRRTVQKQQPLYRKGWKERVVLIDNNAARGASVRDAAVVVVTEFFTSPVV